ncbi:FtsB family cell division protein [Brevundimonas vesicularis]|uniref:FtsB family cell division protein n=1 Tax=Brevundimonas vesicularis TaxID=41276 RepID=UPI0038D36BE2
MFEQMKPYLPSAFLLFMIVYLGVQALTGERGLLSGAERAELLDRRERQLTRLNEQRQDLEVRVRYLRSESLSRDLLEERARAILGFADPRDYVVHLNTSISDRSDTTLSS